LKTKIVIAYLVSYLNEECKNNDDKQVVNDADCSDADVHNLESKVADVGKISRIVVICGRRRRDVVPDINRQRRVLHRSQTSSKSLVSVAIRDIS